MKKVTVIFVFIILSQLIFAQYNFQGKYHNQSIFDIVNEKEENIDIGLWALIIAKEYNNSIDVQKYLTKVESMSQEIKRMLADREKDMDKFLAVKMFLYESGNWNNFKPFSYDLEDPLGKVLDHQILSNYIDSRKGNCVSMPTLFLALMERVDSDVQFVGVKAPLHLFCRLKDRQTGDVWNVETTNGGNPARNQWYIDKMRVLIDLISGKPNSDAWGNLIPKQATLLRDIDPENRETIPTPGGMTDAQFQSSLLNAQEVYGNGSKIQYAPFPEFKKNTANSNSYTYSILNATGTFYIPNRQVPGWFIDIFK